MACLIGLSSACLIEANPNFITDASTPAGTESESSGGAGTETSGGTETATAEGSEPSTGEGCDPGMLDCDLDGVCETEAGSNEHCGACGHSCDYEGIPDTMCIEGECVAELVVEAEADVTLIEDEASDDAEAELLYANGGDLRRAMLIRFPTPEIAEFATPTVGQLVFWSHQVTAPIELLFIEAPWAEDSAQWPGPTHTMVPDESFVPAAGETTVEFNESLSWLANRPNEGVRVRSTHDNGAQFDSREGEHPPRWVIELRW